MSNFTEMILYCSIATLNRLFGDDRRQARESFYNYRLATACGMWA